MSQLGPLANSLVKSYSKEEKYIIMVIMTILNFTTFSQFYISDMGRKIMGSNVVKCSNQWDKFCAKRLVERKILDSNPYFYQIFPAHHDIGMWIITQNFINSHDMLDFFFFDLVGEKRNGNLLDQNHRLNRVVRHWLNRSAVVTCWNVKLSIYYRYIKTKGQKF